MTGAGASVHVADARQHLRIRGASWPGIGGVRWTKRWLGLHVARRQFLTVRPSDRDSFLGLVPLGVIPINRTFPGLCKLIKLRYWQVAFYGCSPADVWQRRSRSPRPGVAGSTIRAQATPGSMIAMGSGRSPSRGTTRPKVTGPSSRTHNGYRSTDRTGMAVPASRLSSM